MKFLLIVNVSPWGSGRAANALRFAREVCRQEMAVQAVYFRGDGVYQSLQGRAADAASPDFCAAWGELAEQGTRLLLCSASARRRLPSTPVAPFEEAGLAAMYEAMSSADRVVSF